MKVLCASVMGMCCGVRRALDIALSVECPAETAILGELVHNEQVRGMLEERGFRHEAPDGSVPAAPRILVPSHGASRVLLRKLEEAGKEVIDATCPFVRGIHETVLGFHREGRFVVVIGKRGHAEVEGLIAGLDGCAVVGCPEEAAFYPSEHLGIVCQSTVPPAAVERAMQAICACNPGKSLRFAATICPATRERQAAAGALLGAVDAMVVVGGKASNNTLELAALVRASGLPCFHVQTADDLRRDWFHGVETVGLTAGASTPDAVIQAVHRWLEALPAQPHDQTDSPSHGNADRRVMLGARLPAGYAASFDAR